MELTRRLVAVVALALVALAVGAAPAMAHAELLSTDPTDGQSLAKAPAQVVLHFSEPVSLVQNGITLERSDGRLVHTAPPVTQGSDVRWVMPRLPKGAYQVSWRVVSDDGHPVEGAFAFGVRVPVSALGEAGSAVSWPIVIARFGGFLGFVLVIGALTIAVVCWPEGRDDPDVQRLLRIGIAIGGPATVALVLFQGPFVAGEPFTKLFDRTLLGQTAHTVFGAWLQLRIYLFLALAAVAWPTGALRARYARTLAVVFSLGIAVTLPGTAHAAEGSLVGRGVDALHALSGAVWIGSLVVLAVLSASAPKPTAEVWAAFSRVALVAVAVVVVCGTLNAVARLATPGQLVTTGYGRVLTVKVLLVLAVLGWGSVSRRKVRSGGDPTRSVRVEAAVGTGVVALTALLGALAPPPG